MCCLIRFDWHWQLSPDSDSNAAKSWLVHKKLCHHLESHPFQTSEKNTDKKKNTKSKAELVITSTFNKVINKLWLTMSLQRASDLYLIFPLQTTFMGIWLLPAVNYQFKSYNKCPNPLSVPLWTAQLKHSQGILILKSVTLTKAKMPSVMDVLSWKILFSLLPLPVPPPLCSSSCHQDTVGFWADFWLLLAPGCLSEPPKSTESSEIDWKGIKFKSERCLLDKTVY